MKRHSKEKWIRALTSGEYIQGKWALHTGDGEGAWQGRPQLELSDER